MACAALATLLAGCGGSGQRSQRVSSSSSAASVAQTTATQSNAVEAVTRNGAVLALTPGVAYSVESRDQRVAASFSPGDAVTVDEEEQITDLRSGRRVSAAEIGATTEANVYPHGGSRHKLATASADGSILVLSDESVWAVSPATRRIAASWTRGDLIAVPNRSHVLYGLMNAADGSTVRASYIGEQESE